MAKNKSKKVIKNYTLLVLTVCVAVAAGLVLAWMLGKEVYLSETKNVHESRQNIVINTVGASSDLVNVLLAEKSGCEPQLPKNVDYIVRQMGNFALVKYGCMLDASMYYKKVDNKWTALSPTNNFVNGVPLCSHVKEHGVPASFQATCYDGTPPVIVANPVE
jgi:hypothetical protein